jgi:hypothetical protein
MHKHHIIPRHAGGTDDPSNIVTLTVEEHAKAHKILYYKYGRQQDKVAWLGLAKIISKEEIINLSKRVPKRVPRTEEHKRNNVKSRRAGKGYGDYSTPESRAKISKALSGVPKPPRTEEHRKNMSKAQKGNTNKAMPITINGVYYPNKEAAKKALRIGSAKLHRLLQ